MVDMYGQVSQLTRSLQYFDIGKYSNIYLLTCSEPYASCFDISKIILSELLHDANENSKQCNIQKKSIFSS